MSDFGGVEIFCSNHVPKTAATQVADGIESKRHEKAGALTKDVGIVNVQVRRPLFFILFVHLACRNEQLQGKSGRAEVR